MNTKSEVMRESAPEYGKGFIRKYYTDGTVCVEAPDTTEQQRAKARCRKSGKRRVVNPEAWLPIGEAEIVSHKK